MNTTLTTTNPAAVGEPIPGSPEALLLLANDGVLPASFGTDDPRFAADAITSCVTRLLEVKQQQELLASEQKELNEKLRLAHLRGDLHSLPPAGKGGEWLSDHTRGRAQPPARPQAVELFHRLQENRMPAQGPPELRAAERCGQLQGRCSVLGGAGEQGLTLLTTAGVIKSPGLWPGAFWCSAIVSNQRPPSSARGSWSNQHSNGCRWSGSKLLALAPGAERSRCGLVALLGHLRRCKRSVDGSDVPSQCPNG